MSRVRASIRTHKLLATLLSGMALSAAWPGAHAGTITRTSSFVYDAKGNVIKEIIEPTSSDLCVAMVYEYDSFGNRKQVTTRNCNGSAGTHAENAEAAPPATGSLAIFAARSASTDYGSTGRFPLT